MAVIPFFAIHLLHYYNLGFEEIENYKVHFAVIFTCSFFCFYYYVEMIRT
jgi:4-hydroxybenzoate polyprenyltransferase